LARKGDEKMYKSKTCYRIICILVTICFVFQNIAGAESGDLGWIFAKPKLHSENSTTINNINIPYYLGRPHEQFVADSDEFIINIQDAHTSISAQHSIINMLDMLTTNYNVDIIALEGGHGPIDTSLLRAFPDKEIKRKASEFLMREGRMSAGEFFSIISEKPVKLYGIEDNDLYQANVDAFCTIVEKRVSCVNNVNAIISALEKLTPKIYSKEHFSFTTSADLHRDGKLDFSGYWESIKVYARNIHENYVNITGLLKTGELEKKIDFKKANIERQQLIEYLSATLPRDELEEFVIKSVEFKSGKISQGYFHQYLVGLAREKQLSPDDYRNLIIFTRYITLYEDIYIMHLSADIERMEYAIREQLFRNKEEKMLYNFIKAMRIVDKLFKVNLTNRDVQFINENKEYFDRAKLADFISAGYARYGLSIDVPYDLDVVFENIDKALLFYQKAHERNSAMVMNTVKAMRHNNEKVAALITGGFHTEGMSKLLQAHGLSYLVIMPKFEKDNGYERPYITVLTNKKTVYEEMIKEQGYTLAVQLFCNTHDPRPTLRQLMMYLGGKYLKLYKEGKTSKAEVTRELDKLRAETYINAKKEHEKLRKENEGRDITSATKTLEDIAVMLDVKIDENGDLEIDESGKPASLEHVEMNVASVTVDGVLVAVVNYTRDGEQETVMICEGSVSGDETLEAVAADSDMGALVQQELAAQKKKEEHRKGDQRRVQPRKREDSGERIRKEKQEIVRQTVAAIAKRQDPDDSEKMRLFTMVVRRVTGYEIDQAIALTEQHGLSEIWDQIRHQTEGEASAEATPETRLEIVKKGKRYRRDIPRPHTILPIQNTDFVKALRGFRKEFPELDVMRNGRPVIDFKFWRKMPVLSGSDKYTIHLDVQTLMGTPLAIKSMILYERLHIFALGKTGAESIDTLCETVFATLLLVDYLTRASSRERGYLKYIKGIHSINKSTYDLMCLLCYQFKMLRKTEKNSETLRKKQIAYVAKFVLRANREQWREQGIDLRKQRKEVLAKVNAMIGAYEMLKVLADEKSRESAPAPAIAVELEKEDLSIKTAAERKYSAMRAKRRKFYTTYSDFLTDEAALEDSIEDLRRELRQEEKYLQWREMSISEEERQRDKARINGLKGKIRQKEEELKKQKEKRYAFESVTANLMSREEFHYLLVLNMFNKWRRIETAKRLYAPGTKEALKMLFIIIIRQPDYQTFFKSTEDNILGEFILLTLLRDIDLTDEQERELSGLCGRIGSDIAEGRFTDNDREMLERMVMEMRGEKKHRVRDYFTPKAMAALARAAVIMLCLSPVIVTGITVGCSGASSPDPDDDDHADGTVGAFMDSVRNEILGEQAVITLEPDQSGEETVVPEDGSMPEDDVTDDSSIQLAEDEVRVEQVDIPEEDIADNVEDQGELRAIMPEAPETGGEQIEDTEGPADPETDRVQTEGAEEADTATVEDEPVEADAEVIVSLDSDDAGSYEKVAEKGGYVFSRTLDGTIVAQISGEDEELFYDVENGTIIIHDDGTIEGKPVLYRSQDFSGTLDDGITGISCEINEGGSLNIERRLDENMNLAALSYTYINNDTKSGIMYQVRPHDAENGVFVCDIGENGHFARQVLVRAGLDVDETLNSVRLSGDEIEVLYTYLYDDDGQHLETVEGLIQTEEDVEEEPAVSAEIKRQVRPFDGTVGASPFGETIKGVIIKNGSCEIEQKIETDDAGNRTVVRATYTYRDQDGNNVITLIYNSEDYPGEVGVASWNADGSRREVRYVGSVSRNGTSIAHIHKNGIEQPFHETAVLYYDSDDVLTRSRGNYASTNMYGQRRATNSTYTLEVDDHNRPVLVCEIEVTDQIREKSERTYILYEYDADGAVSDIQTYDDFTEELQLIMVMDEAEVFYAHLQEKSETDISGIVNVEDVARILAALFVTGDKNRVFANHSLSGSDLSDMAESISTIMDQVLELHANGEIVIPEGFELFLTMMLPPEQRLEIEKALPGVSGAFGIGAYMSLYSLDLVGGTNSPIAQKKLKRLLSLMKDFKGGMYSYARQAQIEYDLSGNIMSSIVHVVRSQGRTETTVNPGTGTLGVRWRSSHGMGPTRTLSAGKLDELSPYASKIAGRILDGRAFDDSELLAVFAMFDRLGNLPDDKREDAYRLAGDLDGIQSVFRDEMRLTSKLRFQSAKTASEITGSYRRFNEGLMYSSVHQRDQSYQGARERYRQSMKMLSLRMRDANARYRAAGSRFSQGGIGGDPLSGLYASINQLQLSQNYMMDVTVMLHDQARVEQQYYRELFRADNQFMGKLSHIVPQERIDRDVYGALSVYDRLLVEKEDIFNLLTFRNLYFETRYGKTFSEVLEEEDIDELVKEARMVRRVLPAVLAGVEEISMENPELLYRFTRVDPEETSLMGSVISLISQRVMPKKDSFLQFDEEWETLTDIITWDGENNQWCVHATENHNNPGHIFIYNEDRTELVCQLMPVNADDYPGTYEAKHITYNDDGDIIKEVIKGAIDGEMFIIETNELKVFSGDVELWVQTSHIPESREAEGRRIFGENAESVHRSNWYRWDECIEGHDAEAQEEQEMQEEDEKESISALDKEAVSLVIGITDADQEEIDAINKKMGGIRVVRLDSDLQDVNLKRLEKEAEAYGAYALGIVDGLDADSFEAAVDELIDTIQERDMWAFLNRPEDVKLDDASVAKLRSTLQDITSRFTIIKSERVLTQSIYEYKLDKIAQMNMIGLAALGVATRLRNLKKRKVASFRVDSIAELRWLVREHQKAISAYGEGDYPVKLHIRMMDENVTPENTDKIFEQIGLDDMRKHIKITYNRDGATLQEIFSIVQSEYGELSPGDVAIAAEDVDVSASEAETLIQKGGMLYVRMAGGIVSQLYSIVIGLIANDNKISDELLKEAILAIHPLGYIIFRPIKEVDMQALRDEIEKYERVVIAA